MIFDLMIEESLYTYAVEDIAVTFDKLFVQLGADPNNYKWNLQDIENDSEAREVGLCNLITAAIDMDILPDFLDSSDFNIGEDIVLYTHAYEKDEVDQIVAAVNNFQEITGLTINLVEE